MRLSYLIHTNSYIMDLSCAVVAILAFNLLFSPDQNVSYIMNFPTLLL